MLPVPLPEPPAPPLPDQSAAAPTGSTRVLVVDDNRDGAESMAALIQMMGATVRTAHDGQEALRMAESQLPHLILLDIGLPGMDGYETARRLRRLPGLHARLVALTGYGAPQDRERAMGAGFDQHLVKPLAPAALQELLLQLEATHEPS
jgi:CheY-like chemotaxis protein